jgi:hypothetical protein
MKEKERLILKVINDKHHWLDGACSRCGMIVGYSFSTADGVPLTRHEAVKFECRPRPIDISNEVTP